MTVRTETIIASTIDEAIGNRPRWTTAIIERDSGFTAYDSTAEADHVFDLDESARAVHYSCRAWPIIGGNDR